MKRSIVAIAILLGGCVTPEQLAYRQQQAEYEQQQREAAYMASLSAQCSQFGFAGGSAEHKQCMLSLHQQNQANRAAVAGALLKGAIAAELLREAQPQRTPTRPNSPPNYNTNCTRDYFGNVNCTSRPQ